MSKLEPTRESIEGVAFPPEVVDALDDVTEMPEQLEEQAEFFDKVQDALSTRLRDES